jgi:hypothetical protein
MRKGASMFAAGHECPAVPQSRNLIEFLLFLETKDESSFGKFST